MNKIDGRYLKDLRENSGLSLRAFADKIYASKSSVQRWEQSTVPEDEDLLLRIAEVFNTPVEEMRSQSEARYGEEALSPEQLANLKFGIKWLAVPIVGIFAAIAVTIIILIILGNAI